MKTCPTLALGAILHIPPLEIAVREEACRNALRIPQVGELKVGDLVGHMRILKIIENNPSLMVSDHMTPHLVLQKHFEVTIPKRDQWLIHSWYLEVADQVWFTDGSKQINGDTGAGILGPNFQKGIAMGRFPSIFQAEIYAIFVCARECLRRRLRGLRLYIMTDSQAALSALSSFEINSKVVLDCVTSLNQLGMYNTLTICWVPGHEGHVGNERADCLANRGAKRSLIAPEPFIPVPPNYAGGVIKSWSDKEFNRLWTGATGLRQSKRFVTLSRDRSREWLLLEKSELRIIVGLFTGHCGLRYHQSLLGNSETKVCRYCKLEDETSEHLLCNCPALCAQRRRLLGDFIMEPNEIYQTSPYKIIGFIRRLNLIW